MRRTRGLLIRGRKNGPWITWNKDPFSNISWVCRIETFKNGQLEGPYFEFWDNGNLATGGFYLNGKKTGRWAEYWIDTTILTETHYQDDEPVLVVEYPSRSI